MSSHYINSRHHWSVLTMEKSLSGLRMCKFWCQPHKAWVRSEFNKVIPIIVLCYISSDLNFRCVNSQAPGHIDIYGQIPFLINISIFILLIKCSSLSFSGRKFLFELMNKCYSITIAVVVRKWLQCHVQGETFCPVETRTFCPVCPQTTELQQHKKTFCEVL